MLRTEKRAQTDTLIGGEQINGRMQTVIHAAVIRDQANAFARQLRQTLLQKDLKAGLDLVLMRCVHTPIFLPLPG
jgi:hypothetical protein